MNGIDGMEAALEDYRHGNVVPGQVNVHSHLLLIYFPSWSKLLNLDLLRETIWSGVGLVQVVFHQEANRAEESVTE